MIKTFEPNIKGNDYVVGDIHGCFDLLKEKLSEISFNSDADRLFAVGDLVDRGNNSAECVKWLNKSWFHSVLGNHEQMAIDYVNGQLDEYNYYRNGGAWLIKSIDDEKRCFAELFKQLPIAIEIETDDGLVGLIHADCPVHDWNLLKDNLEKHKEYCLWSCETMRNGRDTPIANISRIYHGHTANDEMSVERICNQIFIDTGAVFGGDLTILKI